jgi:predicted DNA-binding transcriptional regulator AlpA
VGIDDRFIGKKEVRSLVPYTVQHLRVLEHASEFPGRIRIGDNRSAWLEREVLDWIEDRRSRRRRK